MHSKEFFNKINEIKLTLPLKHTQCGKKKLFGSLNLLCETNKEYAGKILNPRMLTENYGNFPWANPDTWKQHGLVLVLFLSSLFLRLFFESF